MTPTELEDVLAVRGITVYTQGGELRYLAPLGAMNEELRRAAIDHREVLTRLAQSADAALAEALEVEYRRAIDRERHGARGSAA
jgi:hypothetical protein